MPNKLTNFNAFCGEMLEQERIAQYGTSYEQLEAVARLKEMDEELELFDIPNSAGPEFPDINDYLYKVQ